MEHSPAPARNNAFKMLYVLAIIMILDGHLGSYDYLSLDGLLRYQNYHIALFMFASGYFLNLSRGYKEFAARKFTRLIVPLYVWNFFYGALAWYLNAHRGFSLGGEFNAYNLLYAPLVDGHQFIYNMAAWFLVPLFFVQLISFVILKPFAPATTANAQGGNLSQAPLPAPKPFAPAAVSSARKTAASLSPALMPLLFFALALSLGCLSLAFGPENHGARTIALMALRTFYFLPAFAFGFLYRRVLEKYDSMNTPLYLFLILTAIYALTHIFPGYNHIPSWLDDVNAPALVIYAISFLAILFWLRIAKVFAPLLQKSNALNYIAEHTFDLMLHHFAAFMLIKAACDSVGAPGFDHAAYKSDIWYMYFPANDEGIAVLYLAITIVIALLAGFTTRKIYGTIKQFLSHF